MLTSPKVRATFGVLAMAAPPIVGIGMTSPGLLLAVSGMFTLMDLRQESRVMGTSFAVRRHAGRWRLVPVLAVWGNWPRLYHLTLRMLAGLSLLAANAFAIAGLAFGVDIGTGDFGAVSGP